MIASSQPSPSHRSMGNINTGTVSTPKVSFAKMLPHLISMLASKNLQKSNLRIQGVILISTMVGLFLAALEEAMCVVPCPRPSMEQCINDIITGTGWVVELDSSCSPQWISTSRTIVTVSSVFVMVLTIIYCINESKLIEKRSSILSKWKRKKGLVGTGQLYRLIIQCIVFGIHSPPGISGDVHILTGNMLIPVRYRVESVILVVMFLRFSQIWFFFLDWSLYNLKTYSKCYLFMNLSKIDKRFVVKLLFARHAVIVCTLLALVAMTVLSVLVRVFEGPINPAMTRDFAVCCWFIIVSMTTVGFGDVYPVTSIGRLCAAIAMVSGVLIAAVVTAAVYELLMMTAQECTTKQYITSRENNKMVMYHAARIIQLRWLFRHPRPNTVKIITQHHVSREFHRLRLAIRRCAESVAMEPTLTASLSIVVQRTRVIQEQINAVREAVAAVTKEHHDADKSTSLLSPNVTVDYDPFVEHQQIRKDYKPMTPNDVIKYKYDIQAAMKLIDSMRSSVA